LPVSATRKNLQELGYLSKVSIQFTSPASFGVVLGKSLALNPYRWFSITNFTAFAVLSKVLLSFTRYFGDVLESSSTWKYALQDDRRRLSRTVTKTFDRILRYAYGIDSKAKPTADTGSHPDDRALVKLIPNDQARMDANKKPKPPIMAALLPAASHLVDSFLSTSSGALRFQPLLETLHDGLQNHPSTSFLNELDLCIDQVNAVLSFSTTLLRVGILLERPRSQLESQLFKSSPIVSRLYAVNESYRHSVVSLFEALIVSASKDSAEPPSLLGYLGTQTSKTFLQVLSDLDAPLRREFCTTSIWQFMAMVVSNRQPWLANYLLTGRSSKKMLKNAGSGKDLAAVDRSPLNTALDALSRIGTLPKSDALAMLDFVALAQNFWPWATYDSAKHAAFIKSISEYVGTLKPIQPSSKVRLFCNLPSTSIVQVFQTSRMRSICFSSFTTIDTC
jgi:nuclear pore complex protein Nup188